MAAALAVPAWAADCPLEHARYVIRDEAGMRAGFRMERGRLFFFVHATSPDSTQWFLAGENLVSTSDVTAPGWRADGPQPLGTLGYMATDEKGTALTDFSFAPGAPAPAVIVIPRLQEVLHYGFVSDAKEGLSLAFLDYAGCEGSGP